MCTEPSSYAKHGTRRELERKKKLAAKQVVKTLVKERERQVQRRKGARARSASSDGNSASSSGDEGRAAAMRRTSHRPQNESSYSCLRRLAFRG